jgi:hypothetical protein
MHFIRSGRQTRKKCSSRSKFSVQTGLPIDRHRVLPFGVEWNSVHYYRDHY